MAETLSQHPRPDLSIVHISDTHLLGGGALLHGSLETAKWLGKTFRKIEASGVEVKALVFTGDLADRGEHDAYHQLKDLVEPHADALGAEIVWVMGNHDEREPFSEVFFGHRESGPIDRSIDLDGLRIIALDTSVPGYHHGALEARQLEWLAEELSTPAKRGTLLAMHHPPIPTPIDLMGLIELENQESLWSVLRGSDVRGILAGHLHYSTHTAKAGIPVSVVQASCYTIDLIGSADRTLVQVDRAQGFRLVSVYPDQVVFSDLPFVDSSELTSQSMDLVPQVYQMTPEQRRELISKKDSEFNQAVDRRQQGKPS